MGIKWAKEEEKILLKEWKRSQSIFLAAQKLNRSYQSTAAKLRSLQILRQFDQPSAGVA